MITEQVVREFKLVRSAAVISLRGYDGRTTKPKGQVRIELWHARSNEPIVTVPFQIIQEGISMQPQITFELGGFSETVEQALADPNYFKRGRVDALVGVGVLANIMESGFERGQDGLVAQSTSLGWIISGEAIAIGNGPEATMSLVVDDELRVLIQKLWEMEDPKAKLLSAEDRWCEENFKKQLSENKIDIV